MARRARPAHATARDPLPGGMPPPRPDPPPMMYLQVLAGFLLLLGGADILVRGAVTVARRMGISTMIIGMTVVAFGTSAPELIVSMEAALTGAPGIAVGNIVGSNIANVMLIIGLTALCMPIAGQPRSMTVDAAILLAGTLLFIAVAWSGVIGTWDGLLLLAAFAGFMAASCWREARGRADPAAESRRQEVAEIGILKGRWLGWLAVAAGLAGLLLGSDLLVQGGIAIARTYGVPEAVIGLTLIAIGTSLPELAASVVAGLRGHADVAIGNVLGSNLFNMLLVGGTVAGVTPLPVEAEFLDFDMWIMLGATVLFLPALLGFRFGRTGGAAFVVLYAGYIAAQFWDADGVLRTAF